MKRAAGKRYLPFLAHLDFKNTAVCRDLLRWSERLDFPEPPIQTHGSAVQAESGVDWTYERLPPQVTLQHNGN